MTMCINCYECYGAPKPDAAALSLVPLLAGVSPFGGLHIVVADWNIEDDNLEWCMERDDLSDAEKLAAKAMLALSVEQRAAALAVHDGMISDTGDRLGGE